MIASTLCSRTGFLYCSSDLKFYSTCSLPALQMQLHTWAGVISHYSLVQSAVKSYAWCILRVFSFSIRCFILLREVNAWVVQLTKSANAKFRSFMKETSPRKSQNGPLYSVVISLASYSNFALQGYPKGHQLSNVPRTVLYTVCILDLLDSYMLNSPKDPCERLAVKQIDIRPFYPRQWENATTVGVRNSLFLSFPRAFPMSGLTEDCPLKLNCALYRVGDLHRSSVLSEVNYSMK